MGNQGITLTINAETAKAAEAFGRFFGNVEQGLGKVGGMGSFFQQLGGKIAAALTVGSMVAWTREAINTTEAMGKLHEKTGMALSTLSALKDEAERAGTPFEELAQAMGLFSDKMYSAVRQGGQSLQVFRDLGIQPGSA